MDQKDMKLPHVLIFPLPAQGHVNSMLKLAELLCLADLHVTFLVTVPVYKRLTSHTDVQSRLEKYPKFRLKTLPGGFYEGRTYGGADDQVTNFFESLKEIATPFLREVFLRRHETDRNIPPVSWMISDGILGYTVDVAEEFGVPTILFRTISACAFWTYFCVPRLIEAGELPLKQGSNMGEPVKNVKGMEKFLRIRDLPSFCRVTDLTSRDFVAVTNETQSTTRAKGLILNTFEDLEGPILSEIGSTFPNVYTVGPLHTHLKSRVLAASKSASSNSLWEEDKSCMKWLDQQPQKSVIYVSFGSIAVMTKDQILEFWHGLVNSEKRFLWVMRPDLVLGKEGERENIPIELQKGTEERGCIIGWAPQEEVLAHPATGGFLTHSGWNSTLESIAEGVPMVCWPFFADQQINSRFVEEVWRVGLDMKDTCDRVIVEKMIREVMEFRKDEFLERAENMAKLVHKAVDPEGSSYMNLNRLVKDIKSY